LRYDDIEGFMLNAHDRAYAIRENENELSKNKIDEAIKKYNQAIIDRESAVVSANTTTILSDVVDNASNEIAAAVSDEQVGGNIFLKKYLKTKAKYLKYKYI
jgi:hypothetical protein